jgi:hypothetical protein
VSLDFVTTSSSKKKLLSQRPLLLSSLDQSVLCEAVSPDNVFSPNFLLKNIDGGFWSIFHACKGNFRSSAIKYGTKKAPLNYLKTHILHKL